MRRTWYCTLDLWMSTVHGSIRWRPKLGSQREKARSLSLVLCSIRPFAVYGYSVRARASEPVDYL